MQYTELEKLILKYENIRFDTLFGIDEMFDSFCLYAGDLKGKIIPFGFPSLDDALCGGMRPNELTTIIASTNVGKTSIALNVMRNASALTNRLILYFSLELSDVDFLEILIKMEHNLFTGEIEDKFAKYELGSFEKMKEKYSNIKAVVKRINIDEIIPYVKAIEEINENETALVVVDYTQLILNNRYHDAYNKATDTMQKLKEIALHLRVPVLVLSQVNRQSAMNEKGLDMHSGKDSGAIEMSSQILLALERIKEIPIGEINKKTLAKYEANEIDLLRLKVLKKKRGSYDNIKIVFDRKSLVMKEYGE